MANGLCLKLPKVVQRCVYSAEALRAICRRKLLQPPASTKPRIGISAAPAQIKTNCKTSLKMADRNPPSATYAATVADETTMLKLMFHPSTTFSTSAIEYILIPLMNKVMRANEIAESARLASPKRSLRSPGTECLLEIKYNPTTTQP